MSSPVVKPKPKRAAKQRRPSPPGETAERLLNAAMAAFSTDGFAGTDSNRIARAAGFAPQTFYRWFPDKVAIFIACYHRWEQDERIVLDRALVRGADAAQLAAVVIRHHRRFRRFRRSLRQLAVEHDAVRVARAESRKRQAERLLAQYPRAGLDRDAVLITLLQIERLADACAEAEGSDLDIPAPALQTAIAGLVRRITGDNP